MIISEKYMIGIQRINGNWNYAREMQNGKIQFFPLNEWYRDIVWFQTQEDAENWWSYSRYLIERSKNWDGYFVEDSICIRKRVLMEESIDFIVK